jgi:hypothetical protein
VCPNAEHRICVRHLYANFRNEGHRGVLLKDMLWRAASAYTQHEFHTVRLRALMPKHMNTLQRLTLELGVGDGSTHMQSVTSYITIWLNASIHGSPSTGTIPSRQCWKELGAI